MELWGPYKWPYKWLTVLITLVIGVISTLLYLVGGPPCRTKGHYMAPHFFWGGTKLNAKICMMILRDFFSCIVTPWKSNGWNLQPSPMQRKENDLNQTSMILFQPFIFRGVWSLACTGVEALCFCLKRNSNSDFHPRESFHKFGWANSEFWTRWVEVRFNFHQFSRWWFQIFCYFHPEPWGNMKLELQVQLIIYIYCYSLDITFPKTKMNNGKMQF